MFQLACRRSALRSLASVPGAGSRAAGFNPRWSRLATSGGNLQRAPAAGGAAPVASPSRQPAPPTKVSYTDDYEKYQATQKAGEEGVAAFEAGAPYSVRDFRPSTGSGFFDGMYIASQFLASVRVKFIPVDSAREDWIDKDHPNVEDQKWDKNDPQFISYKRRFQQAVAEKWNSQHYWLYCTRPGWERLAAQVKVAVFDVDDNEMTRAGFAKEEQAPPHFVAEVVKIPKGRQYQDVTNSPNAALDRPRGTQTLNSEDLEYTSDAKGNRQRAGVHESGHYFGLGDSYDDTIKRSKKVSHSALSQKELGVEVPIADDARLMSRGEKLDLADAVTFLEAIRAATGMPEWSLQPVFRSPPRDPSLLNDGVPPRQKMA